jgi:hypothetical protein
VVTSYVFGETETSVKRKIRDDARGPSGFGWLAQ